MRTAIFVYQPTSLTISTSENDLELCGMTATPVPLSGGPNALPVAPGIYKIDSSHCLEVEGDQSAFEIVAARKENDPKLTSRASASFGSLDPAALTAFLSAPDAKQVDNP